MDVNQREEQRADEMKRLAIVARLKKGSESRANELVAAGPPFDLEQTGLARHSVYLSATEVVFLFEGHEVEWMVDDLLDQPFSPEIVRALDHWRAIVDGPPRIARESFDWERDLAQTAHSQATVASTP
jgi:hypothetical protein